MHLIFVSDLHLDVTTDGVHRGPEVMRGVDLAVDMAANIRRGGDEVRFIFAGDLADPYSPRSHWAVSQAVATASRLSSEDIHSMWMIGNHDVFDDGSGEHTLMALRGLGAMVDVVDAPRAVSIGGHWVLFLPFTAMSHAYDPDALVREVQGPIEVVVGHLNIQGITPGSESSEYARGRSVYWPLDALQDCHPNAMLIGGHYHERQTFQGVHIIGSMARLTHGEAGIAPGFLAMEI